MGLLAQNISPMCEFHPHQGWYLAFIIGMRSTSHDGYVPAGLFHNVFHDCCKGEQQLVDCSAEVSQNNILTLNHSYIWYWWLTSSAPTSCIFFWCFSTFTFISSLLAPYFSLKILFMNTNRIGFFSPFFFTLRVLFVPLLQKRSIPCIYFSLQVRVHQVCVRLPGVLSVQPGQVQQGTDAVDTLVSFSQQCRTFMVIKPHPYLLYEFGKS